MLWLSQFPAWGCPLLSPCDRLGFPKLPGIPGNPWEFPGILGIPKATLQNREFPSTSLDAVMQRREYSALDTVCSRCDVCACVCVLSCVQSNWVTV